MAMAVSAVDIALWDLKARLLGQPLSSLLPAFRDQVPVYGSGGFTNYPLPRLEDQVRKWAAQGLPRMKVKTSRDPDADPARLTAVRKAAGDAVDLFLLPANGALRPDPGRPGLGLEARWPDLEPYRVYGRPPAN